jgi:type IV pilus assembly protein PilQ
MFTKILHCCTYNKPWVMLTSKCKLSILCVFFFGLSLVYAQKVEPASQEMSVVETLLVDTQAGGTLQDGRVESLIAFSTNTSIREALSVLSERFNVNIVPSAAVVGEIGFTKLRNVTFEQAMEDVLGAGFTYEKVGPTIRVLSEEEYDAMRLDVRHMVHKVFTLYYMSAMEAQKMVKPILSTAGVVESTSAAEIEGGTVDSSINAVYGGDTMADHDRLIVRDYPERIADVEALLVELDVRPKQVLVEATIMSVRLDEDTEFGIDWNAIGGVARVSQTQSGVMSQGFASAVGVGAGSTGGLSVGISSDHFKAIIRALEENTDTTILANPKILAVNKQLGQVYIGKKIGYRDSTGVGVNGETMEGEVKFMETGTKLSFRPYIGNDGYVRMDIFPKDSTGDLALGVPYELSTEMATNILVKDGQTIVIGGLFRDQVVKTQRKVPVLGNLPILGGLFRSDSDSTEREEMVIMLTPHIIDSPDEIHDPEAVEDAARKHQAAKDAMQPISRIKQAGRLYERACLNYVQGDFDKAMSQIARALRIRRNYPEALRLGEKILMQSDVQAFDRLPRNAKARAEAMVMSSDD